LQKPKPPAKAKNKGGRPRKEEELTERDPKRFAAGLKFAISGCSDLGFQRLGNPRKLDAEKPTSLHGLATRIVCTLVGLVLLYVLGYGHAIYAFVRFRGEKSRALIDLYEPLKWTMERSPLRDPVFEYAICWETLGARHYIESLPQTPPATPDNSN
jgi:hypothetical protein